MNPELVTALLGPALAALVTGAGVAIKQAWESRDARQRARRELREATTTIAFIRKWLDTQAALHPDTPVQGADRVTQDLQALYQRVFIRIEEAEAARERSLLSTWSLGRIYNSAIALRVRLPEGGAAAVGSDSEDESIEPPDPSLGPKGRYRRPRGAARVVRPVYWLALVWSAIWTTASFATIPKTMDNVGNLLGSIAIALLVALLLGVAPAVAVRAFVIYLDKLATRQQHH